MGWTGIEGWLDYDPRGSCTFEAEFVMEFAGEVELNSLSTTNVRAFVLSHSRAVRSGRQLQESHFQVHLVAPVGYWGHSVLGSSTSSGNQ